MIKRQWLRRCLLPVAYMMLLAVGNVAGVPGYGAESGNGETGSPIVTLHDLSGRRLGVIAGTVLDTSADRHLDFTQFVYYDDSESQIAGLLSGEIDAVLDDEPVARFLASTDARLRRVPGTLDVDYYGFALRLDDDQLYEEVNGALRELMRDGTLDALKSRWLDSKDDSVRVMPPIRQGKGRLLRLGVSPVSAPFSYNKDGKVVGLDVELIQLVAERLGMRFQVVPMEFSNLITSLQEGKVDIIGSCLSITDDRKKLVRFTDSHYRGGVTAVVLNH